MGDNNPGLGVDYNFPAQVDGGGMQSPTQNLPYIPSGDPLSMTYNVAKGVLDFGTGIANVFGGGGGSSQKGGYTLPPEMEIGFIQDFYAQREQMQQAYTQIASAFEAYDQKVNALNSIIEQGYSPERFQAVQESNFRISQALGQDAEALAKGGFITEDDKKDLSEMQKVASGNYQQVSNPILEGQIQTQRRQLEQELARAGVSPTQRSIALSQFEQSANEQRFGQAQQQFGLYGNLISQRAGLRQQGFGQVTNALASGMGMSSQYMGAYGQLTQNYGQQYQANQAMLGFQQGLRQEQMQGYQTMGQFKISGATKDALSSGVIGPGTYLQQTGMARGSLDSYSDWIKQQERLYSTGQAQGVSRGFENFRQTKSGYDAVRRNFRNLPAGYAGNRVFNKIFA